MKPLIALLSVVALTTVAGTVPTSAEPLLGQVDTFEDGTTQGWTVNLVGTGIHPAPPGVVSGGQGGVDDNYLLLTALGGDRNGSRLAVANLDSRWTGDFIAAGITAIRMDVINLGNTDLYLRFGFEDPRGGPPENIAFTEHAFVAAGGGWQTIQFLTTAAALTAALGDIETAITTTTAVRLYHSREPNFPNPVFPIPSITTQLGVDNISAVLADVPEPATVSLWAAGAALVWVRRRRTRLHG